MNDCVASEQKNIKKNMRRGDIHFLNFIKDGTLIKADSLALAWHFNREEIESLQKSGQIFSLNIEGENYYPQLIKNLSKNDFININQAFDDSVEANNKFIFLMRKHKALDNKTVAQVVNEKMDIIIELAKKWHET